jgi:hypothetical protein
MKPQTFEQMVEAGASRFEAKQAAEMFRVLRPSITLKRENGRIRTTHGDKNVLGLYRTVKDIVNGEHPGHARLIAAAPQMFEALAYVVNWHREHDSGEGELFGLDYVTACVSALRAADPDWRTSRAEEEPTT